MNKNTFDDSVLNLSANANQRDGSFGLYMPKAYQKNRPFGLWFMWFA